MGLYVINMQIWKQFSFVLFCLYDIIKKPPRMYEETFLVFIFMFWIMAM